MKRMSEDEFRHCELKALQYLDEICLKNNIKYFLAFGTLLGGVRHGGFIPWDDDVDVWMSRPDYEIFVEYCIKNEKEDVPYGIVHWKNNEEYPMAMARFYDKRTIVKEKNVREYGLGVYIDVYPLDGCGNDIEEAQRIFKKNKWRRFLVGIGAPKPFRLNNSGLIKNTIRFVIYWIANILGINNLIEKMDNVSKQEKYENSRYVATTVWAIYRSGKNKVSWIGSTNLVDIFRKEWFKDTIRIKFEGIDVNIPGDYDEILTNRYGDYLKYPPKNEQHGHHEFEAFQRD